MSEEVQVELEADAKSHSTNPTACAIKAKRSYFIGWKTVGKVKSLVMFTFLSEKKMEKFLVH